MQNFTDKTVREIAVSFPATARIFEEYKIDFCCGSRRPFEDVCQTAGVAPEIISQKINQALLKQTEDLQSPERKSASELIDYILKNHHIFTKLEIVRLSDLMERVCRKHGGQQNELFLLRKSFIELGDELTTHLRKEETVLFPFIKHLEMSAANNLSCPRPPFKTIKNPVRMMITEHDTAGALLTEMREITKDYAAPQSTCPNFQALYLGLEELEKDLFQHIHLENDVLFPKAVRLEQKVIFGY